MFSFLPDEYRTDAKKGYLGRLALMYLGIAAVVLAAAAALFLPVYILVSTKLSAYRGSQDSALESAKSESRAIEGDVLSLKEKLTYAKSDAERTPIVSVVEKIARARNAGISVTSVSIKRGSEKGAVTVAGKASTREALVSFSKRLQGEPSFSSVNLPVSSLAKARDIAFSIVIDAKF